MAKFQYTNREPTVLERLLLVPANQCDIGSQVALATCRRLDALAQWSDYWEMGIDEFFAEFTAVSEGLNEWVAFQKIMGGVKLPAELVE